MLHNEVEQQRAEFDSLLQSCDLYDTPFEQTKFEDDVTALKDGLGACDKVCARVGAFGTCSNIIS